MLFRKEIEPRCAYCQQSGPLSEEQRTCVKKGIVSAHGQCRHFRYDPLKRVPARPAMPQLSRHRDEDFSL